jgi:putative peptidoglycan lipid II flippase
VLRLLVPGTVGAGVHQINVLFSAAIAAGIPYDGAVTGLRYSNMVMEFVLGIFVFALNTVGLTLLSRHAGRDDLDGFCALIDRLLRLVIFIMIPSTVGLFLLNEPLLALLFKGGVFNERSLSLTASAFRFHVLGILFVGVNRVLVSGFHSRRNLRTPVILAVINMALNLSLAWWLSTTTLAHGGIALATTLAAVAQTVFLGIALKREIPQLGLAPLVPTTIKTLLAASVMGVVCYGVLQVSPQDGGKLIQGARVLGVVAAGVGAFFGVAWVLRAEELRSLLGGLFSRR